jgi:response regulator RpfG family c-di-GMP phosphodiesterase
MAVAGVVDLRTPGSENRTERMNRYMRLLCASAAEHPRFRSQLDPETIDLLVQLTPIHDLGKASIPDSVLAKSGPLTAQEVEIMSRHVEHGRALIERAWRQAGAVDEAVLRMATALVYSHHERWDGTGYPDGLRGEQIPLPARLLAIAEVYDTLVADALHDPMPHDVAVKVLTTGRGTQFDPDLVDSFLASHESFRVIAEESRDNRRAQGTGA